MTPAPLCDGIYVSTQLSCDDIPALHALGIRSVICHRPDGEEETQPEFAPLATALRAAGIAHTYHQPLVGTLIDEDDALVLNHILRETEWPVLMFCRSGTRCAYVWSLLQAMRGVGADELITTAARAGIDLQPVRLKLANAVPIPEKDLS